MVMGLLLREVELWVRGGSGHPNVIQLIRAEPDLQHLLDRPRILELLGRKEGGAGNPMALTRRAG